MISTNRLNVVKIDLPPLSQRREDIPVLIDAFVQKFNVKWENRSLAYPTRPAVAIES